MASHASALPPSPRASARTSGGSAGRESAKLQLSVSRFGLGLELTEPCVSGFLRLDALSAPLLGLSFPVDLSGGVPRFRHRRGTLESLRFTLLREPLLAFIASRLKSGPERPMVAVLPSLSGVTIGIAEAGKALAFELVWAPLGPSAEVVVSAPRAIGHNATALAASVLACEAVFGKAAHRRGARFTIADLPRHVLTAFLPDAGARVPLTSSVALGAVSVDAAGLGFCAAMGQALPDGRGAGALAVELAELLSTADDAACEGRLDDARHAYLDASERAPHHPEIAARLADLDRVAGKRPETALGNLVVGVPAMDAGALGATLLLAVGDREGAQAAYLSAAARETFSPLAALCLVAASQLTDDLTDKAQFLAQAHARSPSQTGVLWALCDLAIERGDTQGLLGLTDDLCARARGPSQKQFVLVTLARKMADARMIREAKETLERALRYVPQDTATLVMLGETLFSLGLPSRAADVLTRALAAAEKKREDVPDAELLLAKVVGTGLGELPLAIARVRNLPRKAKQWPEARALEAKWLAELGDLALASEVYGRMREAIEALGDARDPNSWVWLREAATFELSTRNDTVRAKPHASLALLIKPKDASLRELFRRSCALPADVPKPPLPSVAPEEDLSPEVLDARIDVLTSKLRASPGDTDTAVLLASALASASRDHDLFALTSAQIEDGDESVRARLLSAHVGVLGRLAASAVAEGRLGEARLYEEMLARLG